MRAGCVPTAFHIPSAIDIARADALAHHFGFPAAALESITYHQTPGALAAIEQAVTPTLTQHGITCTADGIAPDHQWILDQSAPALRGVAIDVINAHLNNPRTQPGEQCITVNNTPMVLVESTSDWDIGHVGSTVAIDDAEAVALR